MSTNKLIPDFNAIEKIDWSKPELNTKDTFSLVSFAGAALMVVFVFLPWCSASWEGVAGDSYLGITTWYGILGFIMALVAVVGALYKQNALTFCAAVVGVVFGIVGMVVIPYTTSAEVELAKAIGIEISHVGAILYLIAAVVAAAGSYLKINQK